MGRSIPGFIACCFFAAPSLFVLSPFLASSFRPFFVFATLWLQNGIFRKNRDFSSHPFSALLAFSFENALSFLFWYRKRFCFFSPSFSLLFIFSRPPVYIYPSIMSVTYFCFSSESGKTVDVSAQVFFSGSNFSTSAKIWGFSANYFLTFLSPSKTHLSQKCKIPSVSFSWNQTVWQCMYKYSWEKKGDLSAFNSRNSVKPQNNKNWNVRLNITT